MKKRTVAALAMCGLALAPMSAFASSDREEIEEGCRQAAMDEDVPTVEIADYIAECVAMNLAVDEGEGVGEPESPGEGNLRRSDVGVSQN